jgi:competence protein ComFC
MIKLNNENWIKGYSFSIHTISSTYVGEDTYGNPQFDTQRSDMGECVYQLKYKNNPAAVDKIIDLLSLSSECCSFINNVDIIITIPPTKKTRQYQPVFLIADKIAERFNKKVEKEFLSSQPHEEIKGIATDQKEKIVEKSLFLSKTMK